jgi:hypothetical protein
MDEGSQPIMATVRQGRGIGRQLLRFVHAFGLASVL